MSESGMPQLNTEYFASQIFWLVISFIILYIVMAKYALPKIVPIPIPAPASAIVANPAPINLAASGSIIFSFLILIIIINAYVLHRLDKYKLELQIHMLAKMQQVFLIR